MQRARTVAVCLVALAAVAAAFDFTALKPEGYVSDFARVLDAESKRRLEDYCARLERATGVQLALVTLPSLQGEPIEDVANALFRAWGIGSKKTNEGLLLLLAIRDRRSRLEVGYGLEPVIPDGYAGSVLRVMRPALREQRYGEALLAAASEIGQRVAQAKGVQLDAPLPGPARRAARDELPAWLWLFAAAIPGVLLMRAFGPRRRVHWQAAGPADMAAMVLGTLLSSRGGGWRSGGGFGGFDSGDSFGGFGGGDSGGGGASSNW
ncbi:MAG: TPM domain-containing protein [Bryobacterales bacterium]|nr:TPM domain-containing protein [Bryobacteraceae bacterium]MDW8128979.1 TPM domain-containing protein [Bryobacterales bacterium]